jgi:class 3 adenylate cyclase
MEKFIGDAVVGIFGVPVAHEDEHERAVRAGIGSPRMQRSSRRSVGNRFASVSASTPERR